MAVIDGPTHADAFSRLGLLDGTLTPKVTDQVKESTWQQAAKSKYSATLEEFLEGVRSSLTQHAERKGYHDEAGKDIASEMTKLLGVGTEHAIAEIAYKLIEFRMAPRRVIAEKIAGWCFLLWRSAKE